MAHVPPYIHASQARICTPDSVFLVSLAHQLAIYLIFLFVIHSVITLFSIVLIKKIGIEFIYELTSLLLLY